MRARDPTNSGFEGSTRGSLGTFWKSALVLSSLVLGAFVPFFVSNGQTGDYLIVQGQRVGPWILGRLIEAYGLVEIIPRLEMRSQRGDVYAHVYSLRVPATGLVMRLSACESDGLAFAIILVRLPGQEESVAAESARFKTPQGVGIGSSEEEVLRLLGRPDSTIEWEDRSAGNILVKSLDYPGLRVNIDRADRRVYGIGATARGAWAECERTVLGPTTPQQLDGQPSGYFDVPIPRSLRILPPGPDVPRERAGLSGIWSGKWTGDRPLILAVEEINLQLNRVTVVYAWGRGPTRRGSPGWSRMRALFSGPDLTLLWQVDEFRESFSTFRWLPGDSVEGTLEFRMASNKFILRTWTSRMNRMR